MRGALVNDFAVQGRGEALGFTVLHSSLASPSWCICQGTGSLSSCCNNLSIVAAFLNVGSCKYQMKQGDRIFCKYRTLHIVAMHIRTR
jgi:hypothetical protein